MENGINLTLQELKMLSALEDFRKAAHLPEEITRAGMIRAIDNAFRHLEKARKVFASKPSDADLPPPYG